MTIVTVNRIAPSIKVKSTSPGILSPSTTSGVTLINQGQIVAAANRLDTLNDFVEGAPSDGDMITYQAATDKYIVGPLQIDNKVLDGGTF